MSTSVEDRFAHLEQEADALVAELNGDPATLESEESRGPETAATETGEGDTLPVSRVEPEPEPQQPAQDEMVPRRDYEAAVRRMHQATQEAAEFRRRLEALEQAQKASPSNAQQPDQPTEDDADLASFEEDWPDVAKPVQKLVDRQAKEIETLKATIAELSADHKQRKESEVERANRDHFERIAARHPDVNEIGAAPEFQAWLQSQPPAVRQIAQQGTTDDVIYLLDTFKAQTGKGAKPAPSPRPQSRIEEARKVASPQVGRNASDREAPKKMTLEMLRSINPRDYTDEHDRMLEEALVSGNL